MINKLQVLLIVLLVFFSISISSIMGQTVGIKFSEPIIIDTSMNITPMGEIALPNFGRIVSVGNGPDFDLVLVALEENGVYEMIRVDTAGKLIDTIPKIYRPVTDSVQDQRAGFAIHSIFWHDSFFNVVEQKDGFVYYVRMSEDLELLDSEPVKFVDNGNRIALDKNALWVKNTSYSELFLFPDPTPVARVDDGFTWRPTPDAVANNGLFLTYYNTIDLTLNFAIAYTNGDFFRYAPIPANGDPTWNRFQRGVPCGQDSVLFFTSVRRSIDASSINKLQFLAVSSLDTISPLILLETQLPDPFNTGSWSFQTAGASSGMGYFLISRNFGSDRSWMFVTINLKTAAVQNYSIIDNQHIPVDASRFFINFRNDKVFLYFDATGSTHLTTFMKNDPSGNIVKKSIRYSSGHIHRPTLIKDDQGLLVYGEKISESGSNLINARFHDLQNMNNFSSNEPQLPGESQELPILFQADSQKALCWFETNLVDSIISLTKQNLCFFEKDYPTPSELNSKIELNSSEPQYAPSSVVKDSVMYFTIKWKDGYYGNDRYLLSVNLDNRQLRGFQYKLPRNIGLLPTYEPQSSALLLSGDSVIVAWSDIECTDWNNLGCVGTKEINVYSLLHNDAIQTHQTFSSSSRRHDDEVSEFRSAIINGEWIMVDNLSPRILRFNNSETAFETITGLYPYLTVAYSEPQTITVRMVETKNWIIVAVLRYNPNNSDLVVFYKNWEYITTLDFPMTGLRRDVSKLIYVPEENSVFYAYSSYLPYPFASERILLQSFQLDISTDIELEEDLQPLNYRLEQNYPNPFNPVTQIEYTLPRRSYVQISIYNILGRNVRTLVNREKSAGIHSVTWDGIDEVGNTVSSGVYFYKLIAGDFVSSKKMLLLK